MSALASALYLSNLDAQSISCPSEPTEEQLAVINAPTVYHTPFNSPRFGENENNKKTKKDPKNMNMPAAGGSGVVEERVFKNSFFKEAYEKYEALIRKVDLSMKLDEMSLE